MLGTSLLSTHPLSPSFLPLNVEDTWKTSTALSTDRVLNICTANSLFALVDIPVETDMLLSLIQSPVVDPENERLVRKMSHKPAISGNQQVRKASPYQSGNSPESFLCSYQFSRMCFLSPHCLSIRQGHLSNLCAVHLHRLYICNSFMGIGNLQISLASWPVC